MASATPRIVVQRVGFGPISCTVETGRTHRKQRGIFFTPWSVAERLANTVAPWLDPAEKGRRTLCDPFCGAGILLAALVEELSGGDAAVRAQLLDSSFGVDLERGHLEAAEDAVFPGQAPLADGRLARFDALSAPLQGPGSWSDAFPSVFERGGFDVIVTNPPWEKVRVNDREFFSGFDDGFTRLPRGARDRRREALLEEADVRAAYDTYLARVSALREAAAAQYETTGSGGDLDTYKLAIERCVRLLRPGGVAALIVPHGVLGDWGARRLREWLLDCHGILEVVRMETGPELFPEIHANLGVTFLVVRRGRDASTRSVALSPALNALAEFDDAPRIGVPIELVRDFTEHHAIPLVDSAEDVAFLEACAAFPALGAWTHPGFVPGREVDMTNDRARFRPVGGARAEEHVLPLLEGKQLRPFGLEVEARRFDVVVDIGVDVGVGANRPETPPRIAWRAVADRAMARRLVATWVPPGVALGNSLIHASVERAHVDDLVWLLGWMNSRVADAQLRLLCSNNNINIFHLRAARVPRLGDVDSALAERVRGATLGLLAYQNPGASWLPAGPRVDVLDTAGAKAAVDALDTAWAEIYALEGAIWERSVAGRTASVSHWRGFA